MVYSLDIENTGGSDTLTSVILEIICVQQIYILVAFYQRMIADLHTGGILPENDSRFSYLWYS